MILLWYSIMFHVPLCHLMQTIDPMCLIRPKEVCEVLFAQCAHKIVKALWKKRFDLITKMKNWKRCLLADRKTVLLPLTLAGVQHQVLVVLGADGQLMFCRVEDVEQQVTLASAAGGHKRRK